MDDNKKRLVIRTLIVIVLICLFSVGEIFLNNNGDADSANVEGVTDGGNISSVSVVDSENTIKNGSKSNDSDDLNYSSFDGDAIASDDVAANKELSGQSDDSNSKEDDSDVRLNEVEQSYTFRKESLYEQHFEKHGAEMGYTSKEDYLAGANRVINDPDSLHKTEEEDGDDIYYLESTNEIVFVSQDGYIRTYFSPSSGIDYYNRQ